MSRCQIDWTIAHGQLWPFGSVDYFVSLDQCDQIGRFLQVLGNKLSHKSRPNMMVTFWAISNNVTIM